MSAQVAEMQYETTGRTESPNKRKRASNDKGSSKKAKMAELPFCEVLHKSEHPQVHTKIESFEQFDRVDVPKEHGERQHTPVDMKAKKHTIVVTNPHGTGFMKKAGMQAILVKFQEHHSSLELKPGQLYSLALKDDGFGEMEMLYFTTQPKGQKGEMILLKWNHNEERLQHVNTVARGVNLDQGMYQIDEGHTWEVEAIYKIRTQKKRVNVIAEIRKDIKFLEYLKSNRTNQARKEQHRVKTQA